MATRSLPSHLRNPSLTQHANLSSATPSLQARIEEKRIELANLRELRDLSGQLANQMQMLEEKVGTLSNGTEAVAAVLSNWGDVLKAIGLASTKLPKPTAENEKAAGEAEQPGEEEGGVPLPQTLVRIPLGEDWSGVVEK